MPNETLFFDEAKIFAEAGAGGNGVVSFRREKYVPRGGPDGGHGGKGGDVILSVDPHLNTLSAFRRRSQFKAERGAHGQGSNKQGKAGADLVISVPPGTVVRDAETGDLVADLVKPSARAVVAHGGRGGRGNSAFASSTHQAPRFAEKGEPGQTRWVLLELKLLADVGIIGLPNAGKSTLLSSVTSARPKIADYPFTTLIPNLGVAIANDREIVLADIPGLIQGAHEGVGLGDRFLRHVERTRLLIHVLDGALDDPLAAFDAINRELDQFNPRLAAKPQIVALNKMDLPSAKEAWPKVQKTMGKRHLDAFPISAATGQGVAELLRAVAYRLAELPTEEAPTEEELPVIRPTADENVFEISREGNAFRVQGKKAERVIAMTDLNQEEAILRLHRVFQAMGLTQALEEAGIHPGDMVRIGNVELEWQE